MSITNLSNRGQMEMLGLAVIVILLALGMFFLTKFSLFQSQPTQQVTSRATEVASDFVNTLLNSNAGCEGSSATFTKLINDIEDPDFSPLTCGGKKQQDLVTYFNESVHAILNETMDTWGYKYEFGVRYPANANAKDVVINHLCLSTLQQQPVTYQFRDDNAGIIRVTMNICY